MDQTPSSDTGTSRWRSAVFVALICVAFFSALEGVCRLGKHLNLIDTSELELQRPPIADWDDLFAHPEYLNQRYGVVDPTEQYTLRRTETELVIAPDHSIFRADTLSLDRSVAPLRVLCVGGSSVHGTPLDAPDAFCAQLERNLEGRIGAGRVQCLNGGIPAAPSGTVLRNLAVLGDAFSPDIVVVYTGHNDYYPLAVSNRPEILGGRFRRALTWIYEKSTLIRASALAIAGPTDEAYLRIGRVFEARYRYPTPAQQADWERVRKLIAENYRRNLEAIASLSESLGAKTVLMSVASNLIPVPEISIHDASFPRERDAEFDLGMKTIRKMNHPFRPDAVIRAAAPLVALDRRYAELQHFLGVAAIGIDDEAGAYSHLRACRDDALVTVLFTRAPTSSRAVVADVARARGAAYVDTEGELTARCSSVAEYSRYFADILHFSREGNEVVAGAVAEAVEDKGWLEPFAPPSNSETRADQP